MLSFFSKRPSNDPEVNSRVYAELARTDPAKLHALALGASAVVVRRAAVQVVEDPEVLARVVRVETCEITRRLALRRLTDPEQRLGLVLDPALPEELKQELLVDLRPDPRLCAVYRPGSSEPFRIALLELLADLPDDGFWTRVARTDPAPNIRVMAAGRLRSDRARVELYRCEPDPALRSLLVDFTTNPHALVQMTDIQPVDGERLRILARVEDEAVIARVICTDLGVPLRLALLDRLRTPALLLQVACEEVPSPVALRALGQVKDDRSRAEVAMRSPVEEVRIEALRSITDEDLLDRLEDEAPAPEIRWLAGRRVGSMPRKALDKITDSRTLRRLIELEQEPEVATWLVNRINDRETLRVLGGTAFPGTMAAQRRLMEREGPLGLRFMRVPGRPYEMAIFPATIAQVREALGPEAGGKGEPGLPATGLTPEEAQKFCQFLNGKGGGLYRLPSYEEWWHACLAGDENWLDVQTGQLSWAEALMGTRRLAFGCKSRRIATAAWPNPWGFLDMIGNVAIWVDDSPRFWMHLAGEDPLAIGGDLSDAADFAAAAGVCWSDGKVNKERLRRVVARGALTGWASDKVGLRVVCERPTEMAAGRYKVTLLPQTAPGQSRERAIQMIAAAWTSAAERLPTWYRVAPAVVMPSGTYSEARSLKRLLEGCGAMAQLSPV